MTLDSAVCMRNWGGVLIFAFFIYLARVDGISYGRGSLPSPPFIWGRLDSGDHPEKPADMSSLTAGG